MIGMEGGMVKHIQCYNKVETHRLVMEILVGDKSFIGWWLAIWNLRLRDYSWFYNIRISTL